MTTSIGHTTAIRAKTVIGTNVKNRQGRKIGEVEDIVLDKDSNAIMFAVVSFGGFLGIGEKYHPLPWASLDYDEKDNGYVVDVTEDQLRAAPTGSIDELTRNGGNAFRDKTYRYYKVNPYWH
ncbi:MAG TPA: PRC-barrel domain-containing protein [Steroidobacteraceae bacterium]